MISFISTWAQGIIVAVIIATIIEMILPEGSSKKYIKVVIGIYILFVIVTPVINKFSKQTVDVSSVIDYEFEGEIKQVSFSNLEERNNLNIKSMYEMNLKSDIKNKIQGKGFVVDNVKVEILDNDEYTINKIDVAISGEKQEEEKKENQSKKNVVTIVDNIEKITIDLSKQNRNEKEEKKYTISKKNANNLKDYLSSIYSVDTKNIEIH